MDNDKKDAIVQQMMNVEFCANKDIQIVEDNEHNGVKFPLSEVSALGVAFASMPSAIRTITTTTMQASEGLYRCRFPNGVSGALAQKGSENLGAIVQKGQGIVGQARWTPVEGVPVTSNVVMPFDPTVIFMAATLMIIEKKLDSIQKTQFEILEYMRAEKKADMQGNLNFLSEVLNNYKFNWNNESYKTTRHSQVVTIMREAEQNIVFYRNEINEIVAKLDKDTFIVDSGDVKKKLKKVKNIFTDYQTAMYLYGFATYLDVMLLENFQTDNLRNVAKTIEEHETSYRQLYEASYKLLKTKLKGSIQHNLIDGIGDTVELLGKTFGTIPFIKETKVDGLLNIAGEKIKQENAKGSKSKMSSLNDKNNPYANQFIDSIEAINEFYNEPMEVYIDQDDIYYLPV